MSVEVFIRPILRFRELARPNHGNSGGPPVIFKVTPGEPAP
jgi:hypothetical protein